MIAGMIADEAVMIWKKARVTTVSRDDCIKRVVKTIAMWNNKNRIPEVRENLQFQGQLNKLLDLKPKPRGRGGKEEEKGRTFLL